MEFIKDTMYPDKKVAFWGDNATIHKNQHVFKIAAERPDVDLIYNIPYSPQFMGVEGIFRATKHTYRNNVALYHTNQQAIDNLQLVKDAFDDLDP